MPWHHRYTLPSETIGKGYGARLTVEFRRRDLLIKLPTPVWNSRTGQWVSLPLPISDRVVVGPNILDAMERLTPLEIEERGRTRGMDLAKLALDRNPDEARWRLRDPQDFFPRTEKEASDEHPFVRRLASGGTLLETRERFVLVEKRSTVTISALVFRILTGMQGSVERAAKHVGDIAVAAWDRDIDRSLELYTKLYDAPGQVLLDSEIPDRLKVGWSISQTVETLVLSEACTWLGVDPNMPLRRTRGPRRKDWGAASTSSSGDIVEVELLPDGTVQGKVVKEFDGLPAGTSLESLDVLRLAALLVALRQENSLEHDADLVEAYLDATCPEWRERIAEELNDAPSGPVAAADPWELLGVSPGAPVSEVKDAYRRIMRAIHPDSSPLPRWYAQTVNAAYRTLLEEFDRAEHPE